MRISDLEIITQHDNTRVLRAISRDNTERAQYYVQFVPYGMLTHSADSNNWTFAVLNPPDRKSVMISFDFELQRGVYHAVIEKITKIEKIGRTVSIERDHESRYVYPLPIMVGKQYIVEIKMEKAVCYGKNGVHVFILSCETKLGPNDVYYKIQGESEGIKYYVPFEDTEKIDFFIKGVEPEQVDFSAMNPGIEIKYH